MKHMYSFCAHMLENNYIILRIKSKTINYIEMKVNASIFFLCVLLLSGCKTQPTHKSFSGIYPHLAMYNEEGECGTGAVVPWANKLWVITYGPHKPFGSSDKLYEISSELDQFVRPESTGGTPANRMIHKESNQLNIGPYLIDSKGDVRVISYDDAPGRYTGTARHLCDCENKLYIATMEEGFYEVNVHSIVTTELYRDGNRRASDHKDTHVNPPNDLLLGAHGKGLYSGQGVLVYSNNGEATKEALRKFNVTAGSLSEWDGKEWKLVRRNQFVEVTGPGGIYGNSNPDTDPIWATGWDHKSVLLGVRSDGGWTFYRLPKASNSYDGAHGWNTEWPRIRDIGTADQPDYLMTMHGMFWKFPGTFTPQNSAGIRPRSAYLKVIGDFARWNNQLVFGCDDSAQKEFLNKRTVKGEISGPGQSNSNLWFTSPELIDQLGKTNATGAMYHEEFVKANEVSEPFLFAGWDNRCVFIKSESSEQVKFSFEVDLNGTNEWTFLKSVTLNPNSSINLVLNDEEKGEWVRVVTDKDTKASVVFSYGENSRTQAKSDNIFDGLANIHQSKHIGGILYSLGDNRRVLGVLANNEKGETGYYEVDENMNMIRKDDPETAKFIKHKMAIPKQVIQIDESSVLIVDDSKRRWRLPLGDKRFTEPTLNGSLRVCREVVTERDLFNCMGTFYELPAENADGFAKIRPISSHNFRINDYASYRGLLVMTGINPSKASRNDHIISSADKKAAIWVGAIDDLWKLGKPVGTGGPWFNTQVQPGIPSDPYLFGFYDQRGMTLSHTSSSAVTFSIELDPSGDGAWFHYKDINVQPGEKTQYTFPSSVNARWIRVKANQSTTATCWFDYK